MMYAIVHKKTNRFVYHVKDGDVDLSYDKAITFLDQPAALYFMTMNHLHRNLFEPVKIAISTANGKLRF